MQAESQMLAGSKVCLPPHLCQPCDSTDEAYYFLTVICVAEFLALLRIPNFHAVKIAGRDPQIGWSFYVILLLGGDR
jgi:hypothetical protein